MEAAGWLTRFAHPGFGWLKVSMFLLFQATLAFLLVFLAGFLLRGSARGRRSRRDRARVPAGIAER
jgi:hypothetical protein